MISAGLLNDKILLLSPIVEKSEYGGITTHWKEADQTTHARVQFQRGSMVVRNGDPMMSQTIAVTVRNRHDINEHQRIRWDGKLYRIDSFNRSRADGTITITAIRIEEGD